MSLSDPEVVRAEYACEDGLMARASVYQGLAGPEARDAAFEAVHEVRPRRLLEVGCGWGDFAARVRDELGAEVVAVDISPRMVELARECGIEAIVGDFEELPFDDAAFDCVVANWVLYHARDIDRALGELARVLGVGGRLVAATNSARHLEELWQLVGRDKASEERHFFSEDGEQLLREHFTRVVRRDVVGSLTLDSEGARGYIAASIAHKHLADRVPELVEPLVVTRRCTIFVAETPS